VAGVTLHAVEPAAVNRHDSTLHINQIVLAQIASNPFLPTILSKDDQLCNRVIGSWGNRVID
jgi:hypothetical protein